MLILWFCLLTIPYFVPAHFYPLPTYPEELIAAILCVTFALWGVIRSKRVVCANSIIIWWLAVGLIWYISWISNQKEVVSGSFFYFLFWLLGLLTLVGGADLVVRYGRDKVISFTSRVLVFSGFLYAATGLFTYYGGLKFLIPWISADEPRLVGIMGQPNLSGVYLAIALSAFGFAVITGSNRLFQFRSIVFILLVTLAGVLTGSRAFFLILIAQLLASLLWCFLAYKNTGKSKVFGAPVRYQLFTLLLAGTLFFVYPPIDRSVSEALTAHNILHRQAASDMLTSRFQATGQPRIGEWRKILQGLSIIDNPWLGVGPGSYSEFSVAADEVIDNPYRNGRTWRNAHNIFLMALVEWGVFGLIFVVCFFVFLIILFFKSARNPANYFIWTTLIAVLIHNLVEFSLWHLQFLILFLVLLGTQVKNLSFTLSSSWIRWLVIVPVCMLTVWISWASSRDFAQMVYLFSKPTVVSKDVRTLDLVAQNKMWRPYSRLVMYYRLNPYPTGLENQLAEATAVAEWSPLNLVLMRQASLTAALGQSELACERIKRATDLYPAIDETLDEELVFLESEGLPVNLNKMRACFSPAD